MSEKPSTVASTLASCDARFFPCIRRLLTIFQTLPVTTASAERSFSCLKRLKTYLPSSTGEERLNGLAHMTLNHDIQVDADQVFDQFAAKKDRRPLLWEDRSSFVSRFSKCSWFCFLNFNCASSSVNNVNINTFLAFMAAILGRLRPPPLRNQILGNCLWYNIIFYLFGSLNQGSHRQI